MSIRHQLLRIALLGQFAVGVVAILEVQPRQFDDRSRERQEHSD